MSRVKRKWVFGHMRTVHLLISLRFRAVWSESYTVRWWDTILKNSGQCSSQIRLRGCEGWSGDALSAHIWRPIFAWRGSNSNIHIKFINTSTLYQTTSAFSCECTLIAGPRDSCRAWTRSTRNENPIFSFIWLSNRLLCQRYRVSACPLSTLDETCLSLIPPCLIPQAT